MRVVVPHSPLRSLDSARLRASGIASVIVAFAVSGLSWDRIAAFEPPSDRVPQFATDIGPLLKSRCVKCHGPGEREAGLFLGSAAGVFKGGDAGPVVVPHDPSNSRLWQQIDANQMPPDDPLRPDERAVIRRWILAGAPGLTPPVAGEDVASDHWAFRPLHRPSVPGVRDSRRVANPIDHFIQSALEQHGLTLSPPAPLGAVARRARLTLLGLPPTLDELAELHAPPAISDSRPHHSRSHDSRPHDSPLDSLVDRWLASPQFGPRWAKHWLDAAGYADSNGYFNADTDRPLAYRYRDYVVRSLNADKRLDQFIGEQLAGDELAFEAGFRPGSPTTPEIVEWLEATHFLRNGQDGSGESDGNPDEVRADRYYALESSQQLIGGSLLGLTIQCAKCHDHKFEPITQRDYYQLQAVLYGAFPIEQWVKPNDRFVLAPLVGEMEKWEQDLQSLDEKLTARRAIVDQWARDHRPSGDVVFFDTFEGDSTNGGSSRLSERWSATAPGDDSPGGAVPVNIDADQRPAARVREGTLRIMEGNTAGNAWLSTRASFDWTPERTGDSIQVTFDLISDQFEGSSRAERIGYYIALHDYNDNSRVTGGNLLIDGHPSSSTAVHVDYPGADGRAAGQIGTTGYRPGRNYGVRVTHVGPDKYRLEHLVDFIPEEKSIELGASDLPDGGFGFEYCCGRSFVVDNVRIERFTGGEKSPTAPRGNDSPEPSLAKFLTELKQRRQGLDQLQQQRDALAANRPGKISWQSDITATPPPVHLLVRGNYSTRGEVVPPSIPSVLAEQDQHPFTVAAPSHGLSTGRRLALARWLTRPGSRPASLVARVQVNRVWQHYFGTGLVATSDNLGIGGATPTHPELLEWLASELVDSGWQMKHLHRLITRSATFRQASQVSPEAARLDPSNRLWSRFPLLRLDAESLRDGWLAASGELDLRLHGPYVPTRRNGEGEVVVDEDGAGARRRSLYLYQRRTQLVSFLAIFDSPSIVFLSTQRNRSTTPLQSLALWNSEFVARRATALADDVLGNDGLAHESQEGESPNRESPADDARLRHLYLRAWGRAATEEELRRAREFLADQTVALAPRDDASRLAWRDLAQALLMSNEFLYVE